ncbi:hypothetical protein FRB99_007072 [Tulasnella sp. 403]|nr:hypothetical protein FRB99_007072 [Tulasnella sp. 403]
MLDWCPVCENLIPPERYTIQLPPLNQPATDADKPSVTQSKANSGGTKQAAKRPGISRQNSKIAGPKRTNSKAEQQPLSKVNEPDSGINDAATPAAAVAPAPRKRTIISQDPTPLYCSEKCRLQDEANSALSQMNIWSWNPGAPAFAGGLYNNPYGGREPLPVPLNGSSPTFASGKARPEISGSTGTTDTTTSTDSVPSILGSHAHPDAPRKRPELLQMTSMPHPSSQSNPASDIASSAPPTTDIASHPPNAILPDAAHVPPHGLPLDRWHAQNPTLENPDLHRTNNGYSAMELYTSAYPLAFAPNRLPVYSRTTNQNRGIRSRKQYPANWDDVTPTQSLLIPKGSQGRKDDSLELKFTPTHSDSGSSDRSASVASRRRSERSRSQYGGSEHNPHSPRPNISRSGSSLSGASPSSHSGSFKVHALVDSRQHFQNARQSTHPLSSSFSARDAEEEAMKDGARHAAVSQSVPNRKISSNWSSWFGSQNVEVEEPEQLPALTHEDASTAPPPGTVTNSGASPETSSKTPLAISTCSSSATIAALPAGLPTRSSAAVAPSKASSMIGAHVSGAPKRNTSLANLAGVAASLFGFGGLGGLTMTAAKPPPTPKDGPKPGDPDAEREGTNSSDSGHDDDKDPPRGRPRASSRASQNQQVPNGNGMLHDSPGQGKRKTTKSPLPLSMSMADMPQAKRPLGPLPRDLEERSRSVSRQMGEPLKLELDRKGKQREPSVQDRPSPSVSRDESKSPLSPAPKSAWDPELVRGIKESRRLSREASYFGGHPNIGYSHGGNGAINPFHASPPISPMSPTTPEGGGSRSPYSTKRRQTSLSHSTSHSRSHSTQAVAEEDEAPLPRVKSNHSITSMGTTSSHHRHGTRHGSSREPPSPSTTVYSIAGPPSVRGLPRGLSMTSLSQQGFGAMQQPPSMYGPNSHNGAHPHPGTLSRTTSQPYVARWFSTSPGAGGSAFGSPSASALDQYHTVPPGGIYSTAGLYSPIPNGNNVRSKELRSTGPTYPVLALPSTRKKKVMKSVVQADGREEKVLVDGEEEEEVYEKKKRLFYFDR